MATAQGEPGNGTHDAAGIITVLHERVHSQHVCTWLTARHRTWRKLYPSGDADVQYCAIRSHFGFRAFITVNGLLRNISPFGLGEKINSLAPPSLLRIDLRMGTVFEGFSSLRRLLLVFSGQHGYIPRQVHPVTDAANCLERGNAVCFGILGRGYG